MTTVFQLATQLKNKEISSLDLVESYLQNIQKKNNQINAFIHMDECAAKAQAKDIDEKRMRGESLPFLAGIPVSIKDNICTENMPTTCASKMLENFIPPYQATVVQRMLDHGIIPFGKTNMDEFAMGTSTESSYWERTYNPRNLSYVPGGSSGGSAAAVAAKMTPLALGTDTGGSIRQPASFCGIVGLKPTYGRVSRYGAIAFASSFDQIGPMANTVEDVALLMNVICGYDIKDSTSILKEPTDFTKHLKDNLKGKRIGLIRECFGDELQEDVRKCVLQATKAYEKLGAIVEEVSIEGFEFGLPAYFILSSAEASSNLARYDGIKYGHCASNEEALSALYKKTRAEGFGSEVKRRIMLGTYVLSAGQYDIYYEKAQRIRQLIINEVQRVLASYDVLLSPTCPIASFPVEIDPVRVKQRDETDVYTVLANLCGLPAISIPCGYSQDGVPIGMQLIGKAFEESTVLNIAYQYENREQE